jgi:hypothetical protein
MTATYRLTVQGTHYAFAYQSFTGTIHVDATYNRLLACLDYDMRGSYAITANHGDRIASVPDKENEYYVERYHRDGKECMRLCRVFQYRIVREAAESMKNLCDFFAEREQELLDELREISDVLGAHRAGQGRSAAEEEQMEDE